MTAAEFSDIFDVLYNNITSNQAAGLTEYEKSVFLTKAQNLVVKNYFTANSQGNNILQGFDDSAKRLADFSCLMKTGKCIKVSTTGGSSTAPIVCILDTDALNPDGIRFIGNNGVIIDASRIPSGNYTLSGGILYTDYTSLVTLDIDGAPVEMYNSEGLENGTLVIGRVSTSASGPSERIDARSDMYQFPNDVFIVINEAIKCTSGKDLLVIPLRYDDYVRLMSKPYKRPLKYQAWRLINTGESTGVGSDRYAEIIVGPNDTVASNGYSIRYIRFPKPIILGDLDGLSIDGWVYTSQSDIPSDIDASHKTEGCELDPIIHEDILQRAVELAKIAWTATGNENTQLVVEAGKRSE